MISYLREWKKRKKNESKDKQTKQIRIAINYKEPC